MRKLLIVDPSLISLEGHSYNYDVAIAEAAKAAFDDVQVYADLGFRDPSGRLKDARPVLNRLRIDSLKGLANAIFYKKDFQTSKSTTPHATVVPGVWPWLVGIAKWARAKDLEWSLRDILRRERRAGDEIHVFFQHAHFSELMLAARMAEPVHLHLVLRYSPDLVNAGRMRPEDFSALLVQLGRTSTPRVHLYTDSERLSAEYERLGARSVRTLPVPILMAGTAASEPDPDVVRISFVGAARVEKGFCELPSLIERFPRRIGAAQVQARVQVSSSNADPRVREATQALYALAKRLPHGALQLVESPVSMERYYALLAESGVVALPYVSHKYNASTSGIFVEALCFGVPVIAPAESWMADVMAQAQAQGLTIGEVVGAIDEIPAALEKIGGSFAAYRGAVREFARLWRATHNPEACIRILIEAASR
jgi:glycosyltransferase involved in cell wall biosynthesis